MHTYSYKLLALVLILLCIDSVVFAQSDSSYIAVKARHTQNSVLLRWSVSDSYYWNLTNGSGFRVERYTIKRNNNLLDTPEKIIIANDIKPLPLEKWEFEAKRNPHAAVVAQALYGESFNIGNSSTSANSLIVDKIQEQEQRFFFSMYIADLDFYVAQLAGWAFKDSTISTQEEYLYRIYPVDKTLEKEIGYAYTYVNFKDEHIKVKPTDFELDFGDHIVNLVWNTKYLKNECVAYQVERSEDGKNFRPIFDPLVMNTNETDWVMIPDTLPENGKTYYYRMYGVDLFGEKSEYSDVVSGEGYVPLKSFPIITNYYINDNGVLNIEWDFDTQDQVLKNFELRWARYDKDEFVPVVQNIDKNTRKLEYKDLFPTNYFVVVAVPQKGKETSSLPIFVQPVDSVPPLKPQGLKGEIDSLGIVKLHWNSNKESDVLGYRIFRSLNKGGGFWDLNDIALMDTFYVDTVDVHNLNTEVSYKVAALDLRYNQSELSDSVVIIKPDYIAPTTPIIKSYSSTKEGIVLTWINSSSEDAKFTQIYRVSNQDTVLIKKCTVQDTIWCDDDTEYGNRYLYYLRAEDASGLLSSMSPCIEVKSILQKNQSLVAKLDKMETYRMLTWKLKLSDKPISIVIYRKQSEGKFSFWKRLDGNATSMVDKENMVGETYQYYLKIEFEHKPSIYSEILK